MSKQGNTLPLTEYYPISWVNATGTRTRIDFAAGTAITNQAPDYVVSFTLVSTPESSESSSGPIAPWTLPLPVGSNQCGGSKPMALRPGAYTLLAVRVGSNDAPMARSFHVR